MSAFIPNTTVSVFRNQPETEESPDVFGDYAPKPDPPVQDADATGLYALLTDGGQRTYQPASGEATVVHKYKIQLRPKVFTFSEQDRVKDERTGLIYLVDAVATDQGTVQESDIILTVRRVT